MSRKPIPNFPARDGLPPITVSLSPNKPYLAQALAQALAERTGQNINQKTLDKFFADQRIWSLDQKPLSGTERTQAHPEVVFYRPISDDLQAKDLPPLQVLWENPVAMVVFKPGNLATMPRGVFIARSVVIQARRQWSNPNIIAAHRLDRFTDGCLLLVKDPHWRGAYQQLFDHQQVRKHYQAWSKSLPTSTSQNPNHRSTFSSPQTGQYFTWHAKLSKIPGKITVNVNSFHELTTPVSSAQIAGDHSFPSTGKTTKSGKDTITKAQILVCKKYSSVGKTQLVGNDIGEGLDQKKIEQSELYLKWDLWPQTGYMHQLRAVLCQAGYPICGDPLYPVINENWLTAPEHKMWLRSVSLTFPDPYQQEEIMVRADSLPDYPHPPN